MMNLISKELVTGIIAGVLAGILLPWLGMAIRYFFGRVIVFRKETNIRGVYDCKYYIHWKPEGENIILERIFVFSIGKKYYGFLINNPDNSQFRKLRKPGLRLKGELFVERFLIGWWRHPLPDDRTYGAFNLKIDLGGINHNGQWSGESTTYNRILEGRWEWSKQQDVKYGMYNLIRDLIKGNK